MLQSSWFDNRIAKEQGGFTQVKNERKHTARSSDRSEYHLVFVPKYRRKEIDKAVCRDIIEIIKKLCKEMKVEIIEGGMPGSHSSSSEYSAVHGYSAVRGAAREQKSADDLR